MIKKTTLLALLFSLCLLSGCKHWWGGNDDEDYNPYQGMTAQQLYQDAKTHLHKKLYSDAIKRYEALDTMYPFSDHAETAQLELIYAYYKKEDYPSASATAERFIHLYPRSSHVDYAYFMKGLSDFNQSHGTLASIAPLDKSIRDPGSQAQAYSDFASLVQKFPKSRYRANAMQRMIYLRNMFANRELHAAYDYYDRKMYVAAEERASYLIRTYPQAPTTKQALAVVYYANLALGLKDAAQDALSVYQASFHENPRPVRAQPEDF